MKSRALSLSLDGAWSLLGAPGLCFSAEAWRASVPRALRTGDPRATSPQRLQPSKPTKEPAPGWHFKRCLLPDCQLPPGTLCVLSCQQPSTTFLWCQQGGATCSPYAAGWDFYTEQLGSPPSWAEPSLLCPSLFVLSGTLVPQASGRRMGCYSTGRGSVYTALSVTDTRQVRQRPSLPWELQGQEERALQKTSENRCSSLSLQPTTTSIRPPIHLSIHPFLCSPSVHAPLTTILSTLPSPLPLSCFSSSLSASPSTTVGRCLPKSMCWKLTLQHDSVGRGTFVRSSGASP